MTPEARRPYIAANWKMHKTQAEAGEYVQKLLARLPMGNGVELALCPPFTALGATVDALGGSDVKVLAAREGGLQPMLSVGETEDEHEAGDTQRKLRHQVQEALEKVPDNRLADVVIAYEPIWAIGTGKVATPDLAQDACGFIRALVGDRSKDAAERVRVLYGGSMKPENAGELLGQPDIDGGLVGGASLDPADFAQIVAAAR